MTPKLTPTFLAVLCALAIVATGHPSSKTFSFFNNPLNDKIGIIGAGPSGLFAARELQRKGYTRVTVLERSDVGVANVTNTIDVDGSVFDLTTRFVPTTTFSGPGIPANLKEMIDDLGLPTTPTGSFSYLDTTTPQLYPAPHVLAAFPPTQILSDMLWGWGLLTQVSQLGSITACHAAGISPAGESFAEFSDRVQKGAFTSFAAYLQDLFLGGRAVFQDACMVLNVRARFMSSDIATVLKAAGLTSSFPGVPPALGALLDLSFAELSRSVFDDGYQNFFDQLVQYENLDVKLGQGVQFVHKFPFGKSLVVTNKFPFFFLFDKLIIATRPWDALSFLPQSAPIRPLYAKSFFDPVFVLLARTTGTLPLVGDPYNAILYPQSFLVGTANLPYDGVPLAASKFFGNVDATVTIGFASSSQSTADLEQISGGVLASNNVTVNGWINSNVYPYVADVSAADAGDGFFEDIDSIQGQDGYFYVSEAMAGSGVPSVLDYVQQITDRFF
mmetsp:Transcript_5084/g.7227  ORF Transcript_5084/g.7227 Transcript_5084/m.7227 type:complete len:501 (-) Transcript_5084:73-1575(-)